MKEMFLLDVMWKQVINLWVMLNFGVTNRSFFETVLPMVSYIFIGSHICCGTSAFHRLHLLPLLFLVLYFNFN